MSTTILDAVTRAAATAATTQDAQLVATAGPWAGGDVTVHCMAGAVVAEVCIYEPWRFDTGSPRGMSPGRLKGSVVNVSGATLTSFVAVAGSTAILATPASDLALDAPTTQTGRRTSLADDDLPKLRITADQDLPLSKTYLLTVTLDDTGTAGVDFDLSLANPGTGDVVWSIAPPTHVTLSETSGTVAAGATTNLTGQADEAGTYTLTVVSSGTTIAGNGQSIVVAAAPATTLTLSVPSTGTAGVSVDVTATPNGAVTGGGTATVSTTAGTLGSDTLTWADGDSAAKTTTLELASAGGADVSLTTGMSLSIIGSPAEFIASAYVPAWRASIAVNTWGQVGSSEMADVDPETSATYNPSHPSAAPWRGSNGQAAIINAWGSGCWDEANLALWMPLGGGHQNYYGNEAYKQSLGSDTAPWSTVIPPTGAVGNTGSLSSNGTDSHFDGQPRSPHTYGNAVYVPGIGPVMPRIAFYDGSATSSQGVWRRNPTTGVAEKVHTFANNWTPVMGCCYDPTRNRIYSVAKRNDYIPLEYVIPDSGSSWSGGETTLRELQHGDYGQLRYIASIDRVAFFTGSSPGVQIAHPTTGATTTLTLNGTMPTFLSWSDGRMGVDWCDDLGCLLLWNNGSSLASFATLTPDGDGLTSWTWGTLAPDAGNTVTPPAAAEQGTYGRLIYSASLGGMVLLNSVSSPTVFFATR